MSYPNDYVLLRVAISPDERKTAYKTARLQGMTFQDWLAKILRKAISDSQKQEAAK